MADNWMSRLNPLRGREERLTIKSLQTQLEKVTDELEVDYSAKFLDVEPSQYSGSGSDSFSGIDQSVDNAMLSRLYMSETWVYVGVNAVSQTIAGLPMKLEKRKVMKKTVRNEVTNQDEQIDSEVWTDASGETLARKFQFPNAYTTKAEFLSLLAIDLLTCGEYFVYLESDYDLTTQTRDQITDTSDPSAPLNRLIAAMGADTKVKAMYRIPPQLMRVVPSEDRRAVEGYVMQSDAGMFAYNFAEIIHVKLPNPANQFTGLSPLVAALKPVLLDRFSTEHMIRFYKSGARLGGVITTEKNLGKEQLSRFQRSFEASYTGRANHHRTLVLPPGMKYEQQGQNPAETALLDFCRYNREAILAVLRVPPIKVGIMDGANYANALVQLKIFFEDTIKPILTFIEDGFNHKASLMPAGNTFRVKFDLSEVEALKDNFKEKAEAAKFMIDSGLSVNEVRSKVWAAGPIEDGDKVKVIEDIKSGKTSSGGLFGLSAKPGDTKEGDAAPGAAVASELQAELTGPQTTAVMNILGRVAKGRLTKEQAAELLVSAYSIPRELACKLAGIPYTAPQSQAAPEQAKQEAPEWTPTAVGNAPLKDPCLKCKKSPCECPPTDGGGKSGGNSEGLNEFIADAIAKLSPGESVTAEFIAELMKLHSESQPTAKDAPVETKEDKIYPTGHSKSEIADHWKSFVTKTDPMVERRVKELHGFFAKVKAVVLNKLGANVKSFGLHKARDEKDTKTITDLKNFEKLIKEYVGEVDKALMDAFKEGFSDTLTTFTFGDPNEMAAKFLEEYATDKVTGIMETTLDQISSVLNDGFKAEKPIGEISKDVSDKFAEIDTGRAHTIARTETLTAVSAGREAKRQGFAKEFPDQKLMKMWVSAQDDRVRDSHAELDGTSVGADEEFANGLKYPRDPSGPAEEVINCRCTDITFAEEDKSLVEDTLAEDGAGEAQDTANAEVAKETEDE